MFESMVTQCKYFQYNKEQVSISKTLISSSSSESIVWLNGQFITVRTRFGEPAILGEGETAWLSHNVSDRGASAGLKGILYD